ncbi:MAG TPA: TssQ family T6SS-associated lipoprotein [Burkholderiaceae bacterium]|nr:TssQ family T6SS-associated lipoprotein [Burkholderiaceae bacterium]
MLRPARSCGAAIACLLAGCAVKPAAETTPAPVVLSAAQLWQRPPERALFNGLRFYEEGLFDQAEQAFRSALLQGLRDRRDVAVAHKFLAFIACAFNRLAECEQQFRNAVAAEPTFILTDAEIGHPIWGPVYRKVVGKP